MLISLPSGFDKKVDLHLALKNRNCCEPKGTWKLKNSRKLDSLKTNAVWTRIPMSMPEYVVCIGTMSYGSPVRQSSRSCVWTYRDTALNPVLGPSPWSAVAVSVRIKLPTAELARRPAERRRQSPLSGLCSTGTSLTSSRSPPGYQLL